MKKINFIISAVLVAPLLTFGTVFAESTSPSSGSGSGSTSTTKPEDTTTTPSSVDDMKKRIEGNKTVIKTKLDDATKKKIMTKCKPAQGLTKGAETSADSIKENRGKAFTKISESVQKVIDKLKAAGKDTTELEADLAVATQKALTLTTAMNTYKQTLADLRALDCAADPTAFQATLVTARTQRDAAKAAAVDLRTYLSTTLKTALNKVKTGLEAEKPKTESESEKNKSTTDTKAPETTGGTQ